MKHSPWRIYIVTVSDSGRKPNLTKMFILNGPGTMLKDAYKFKGLKYFKAVRMD